MSGKAAVGAADDGDLGGNVRDRMYDAALRKAWPIGSLSDYWRGRWERYEAMKRARAALRRKGVAR